MYVKYKPPLNKKKVWNIVYTGWLQMPDFGFLLKHRLTHSPGSNTFNLIIRETETNESLEF